MLMYFDTKVINYIAGEGLRRNYTKHPLLMYIDTKVINYIKHQIPTIIKLTLTIFTLK